MPYEAGVAYLQVEPSFRGIEKELADLADRLGNRLGNAVEKSTNEAVSRSVDNIAKQTAGEARRAGEKVGQQFGGKFAETFQRHMRDAMRALPDIGMAPARDAAEQLVKDLRGKLDELSRTHIGVDVDTGAAVAKVEAIKTQLADLAKTTPDVRVQVDAVAAAQELAAVEAMADRLDRHQVDIKIDADRSSLDNLGNAARTTLSHMEMLIAVSLSLGTMLVPAAAAVASAVGFIGTAAASAASGIGVMGLAFSGVGDAVKALQAYQDDAEKSTASLASAQFQAASAAAAVSSAERSLANVRANNAESLRRANRTVEDAERSLARAQNEARESVLALARAREEARRALQDMAFDVEENALALEKANLDQAEAKRELDKLMANPRATEAQREAARIAYEEITLRIKRLGVQQERLAADQAEANKAGIEGSKQVVAAQEQIRAKNETVEQAQRRLAEAQASAAAAQRQAAFSVAQAQQALANAHRQVESAATRAGVAGGAALDTLNEAMEKLSPTGQRFARFIFDLRDEFLGLRAAAADNMLPGVQRSIEQLLPYLPEFRGYVGRTAAAMGELFAETSRFLTTDPTWRRFISYLDQNTVPTLERLWRIGRNVSTGLVGLINAFEPFNEDIGGGLERLTDRFARWSATLDHNQGFQQFLAYVRDNGPKVVDLIDELTTFVGHFVQAAAPVGTTMVQAFTLLFRVLNSVPIEDLEALVEVVAALAGAIWAVNTAVRIWSLTTGLVTRFESGWARTRDTVVTSLAHIGNSTDQASRRTNALATSLDGVDGAAGRTRKSLSAMASMFGSGGAMAGAAIVVGTLATATAKYRTQVDALRVALGDLGEAYEAVTKASQDTAASTEEALRGILKANPDMQKTVLVLDSLGVSFEELARAATGSQADVSAVLAVIDEEISRLGSQWQKEVWKFWDPGTAKATSDRIAELRRMRQAILENADAAKQSAAAQEIANGTQKRANDLAHAFGNFIGPVTVQRQRELVAAYDANATKLDVLQKLVDAFGKVEATAADKANALRQAIDLQTSATVNAIEGEEAWSQSLISLREAVEANGTALSINSRAGLANRDALQAAAKATRDLYLADIASGVPMEQATKRHQDRITKLREEANRLDLTKTETEKLIKAYGDVPDDVQTAYQTKGFDKVWEELTQLKFIQEALAKGWTLEQAQKQWKTQQWWNKGFQGPPAPGRAQGGPIFGAGTKTSDSILIRASHGEFMQPAASVDYYGPQLMEALRRRAIPREQLPGFARGGLVQWPAEVDLSKTFVPTLDEVLSKVVPAGSAGGIGSADMMRLLRVPFPGLALYSGYRPGSRTASGALSYHARIAADGDKGRAVDIPPLRRVFDWIHDHYMALTKELIWLGDANRNIWNGKHHRYSQALLNQHGVAGMPNAHIHWAMDNGGLLRPGWNPPIWNGTGKPEPVLTDTQWQQIAQAARGADSPATEYNLYMRDTTLTPALWKSIEDRNRAKELLARPGRAR